MKYEEAVTYLLDIPKFAAKTGPDTVREFLMALGNPQNKIPSIHVAGTNGKGSTCAFLASVLRQAGYQTGLFTSPHLVRINERFRLNETWIGDEDFLHIFLRVKEVVDQGVQQGMPHPNFFEFLFLMAVCWYEAQEPDYVIYETGLGGRLDATNVLTPCLTILTSIGMDHMQYLGNTIGEIAAEKAGILKQGVPCIYLAQKDAAEDVIRKRGEELGILLIPVEKDKITIDEWKEQTIDFSYRNRYDSTYSHGACPYRYTIRKTAVYQTENAALAIEAGYYLLLHEESKMGTQPMLPPGQVADAVHAGIANMVWQGRMEELEPDIYVDGAHNEPAIRAFCDTVSKMYRDKKIILLFAVAGDKRYNELIQILCEELSFEKVIVTAVESSRFAPVEQIAEIFRRYTHAPVVETPDCGTALEQARICSATGTRTFCVGSLYLVGSLKAKKEEEH